MDYIEEKVIKIQWKTNLIINGVYKSKLRHKLTKVTERDG